MDIDITVSERKTILNLLETFLPETTVWAFGSRVKFTAKPESDLDLVAFIEPEQEGELTELKEAFAESDLSFKVDILDWNNIPDSFKQNIEKSYIALQNKKAEKINIPNNWKSYRLKEITKKIGSGATPRGGKEAYLEKSHIALIRSQNVLDFSFSRNGLAFISEDQAEELRNVIIQKDDVLLNITGDSVARVCMVPDELIPARVNQHVAIIRASPEKINANFLKYYLLEPSIKNHLLGLASAGATRNALTKTMLENLQLVIPDIASQNSIAEILLSLDNKIALNVQMNETLENIAQNIFKDWFVDFKFPGFDGKLVGGLPKGWHLEKLGKVTNVEIGRTPPRLENHWFSKNDKDIKWISIRDLGKGGAYIFNTSEYLTKEACHKFNIPLIPPNTVVLSFKLTLGRIGITTEKMLSNEAIAQFQSDLLAPEYIYCFLKNYNFESLGSTSSIATAINSKIIKNIDVLVPPNVILDKYCSLGRPLFARLKACSKEIETLTEIRDGLLGRLMTGKIQTSA